MKETWISEIITVDRWREFQQTCDKKNQLEYIRKGKIWQKSIVNQEDEISQKQR